MQKEKTAEKTAVEWLMENLHTAKDPFTQAKQMEKEQIIEAYISGCYAIARIEYKPEQYYQERFSKE